MPRQPATGDLPRNWSSSAHLSKAKTSRTSVVYWRERVEKTVSASGAVNPDYSARLSHGGRRVRFPLNTPNRDEAASRAAKIYKHLVSEGWDDTLSTYKPGGGKLDVLGEAECANTVGALISAARRFSSAREQSLNAYEKALRSIVAGIEGIEKTGQRFDTRDGGGNSEWRKAVDAVPLARITPAKVQEWKTRFLAENGSNPEAAKRATTTVNSLIRNAKALYAKKLRPFLSEAVEMPEQLPFDGVTMEKAPSVRYRSKIDARRILHAAKKELRGQETYKVFLLALVCGLRVSEIDYLLWSAFDFDRAILTLEHTRYHRLKSDDSEGELSLSPEFADYFRKCHAQEGGEFVVRSDAKVERSPGSGSYRCQKHLDVLKGWLRGKGIDAPKPIHEMRKEVGSVIASESGIFAASRYLRHSDIRITAAIYADQKEEIIPSMVDALT